MNDDTRKHLVQFIVQAIYDLEEYKLSVAEVLEIERLSDADLQEKADWYDYLLGK